jgi:hypothetical protein
MSATVTIRLKPFEVPTTVFLDLPQEGGREKGMLPSPSLPITALTVEQLLAVADKFKLDMLRAAGKLEEYDALRKAEMLSERVGG